jgi:hypothetical protein
MVAGRGGEYGNEVGLRHAEFFERNRGPRGKRMYLKTIHKINKYKIFYLVYGVAPRTG